MSDAYSQDIDRIVKAVAPSLAAEIEICAAIIAAETLRLNNLRLELDQVLTMVKADEWLTVLEVPKPSNGELTDMELRTMDLD